MIHLLISDFVITPIPILSNQHHREVKHKADEALLKDDKLLLKDCEALLQDDEAALINSHQPIAPKHW